jgi:hypothetical protein
MLMGCDVKTVMEVAMMEGHHFLNNLIGVTTSDLKNKPSLSSTPTHTHKKLPHSLS